MHLHTLNPSIKALTVIVLVTFISIVFDPVTTFLYWLFILAVTFIFGKVEFRKWLLIFIPFLFVALGYVWTAIAFSKPPQGTELISYLTIGPINVTNYGISSGLGLGMRVLCFAGLSMLFILTTDPVKFILSLVQQCKLPPKLAYGILAGYRFLPLLTEEIRIIRHAHKVRGANRETGMKAKLLTVKRYAIPLLASAIRKAERAAIAMESKGFTGSRNRTYYKRLYVKWQDWLFLSIMVFLFLVCVFVSMKLGTFRSVGEFL
ncbi:energy-coupling factor transporter transmembrane component T [Bacillus sp. FJAT-50079]|uniref:energy-coupling factor transporter transmembrane component T family protein n=1 Tax=Bacillus sp. FJAT-50079 TaxID=2833577 RepID=UPI001BC8FBE0|nr:energy-coupling factor transporter transmembrane component T [Bacillus sp. FJAT-50079]MBS4206588.1 energy-coupling factor transporter transmembrane protein EcfT [Bacillus sp. FJAT-50079]